MKRSLHEDGVYCAEYSLNDELRERESDQGQSKRMKRSSSSSGIAAMTLLSLALTASKREHDSSTLRLPMLNLSSIQGRSNVPTLIPCDTNGEQADVASLRSWKKELVISGHATRHPESKVLVEKISYIDCCALTDDWKKVFRPLPLPPMLPQLPAGAKARTVTR